MSFLLYGANGYTGTLIARECVRQNKRPVLAGRNEKQIRSLAEELALDYRIVQLDDTAALRRALEGMSSVLHCAGPYAYTSRPMADACLYTGTHYLDLTGEIPVMQELYNRRAEAERAGVMILSGAGFDIVPTDCVAAMLKKRLPDAHCLYLAVDGVGRLSHGTMNTVIASMNLGGLVRKNGALHEVPTGWKTRSFNSGTDERKGITMPLGDVLTAYISTGIPNIETYVVLPLPARMILKAGRFAGPFLRMPFVPALLRRLASLLPAGPSAEERVQSPSRVYGEAYTADNKSAAITLHAPNVYTFTARLAVAAAQHIEDGIYKPGFQTPSLVFGPEFVLEIEGVEIQ
jgi:short subunit dehydrogenase-like uncharacterized protein